VPYTAQLVSDVVLDVGVFQQGSTLLGATRGGASLRIEKRWASLTFDGMRTPVVATDRLVGVVATIEATFLPLGESAIQWYESQASGTLLGGLGIYQLSSATAYALTSAAAYAMTSSSPGVPDDAGVLLAANRYLTDFRWIANQGDGGTVTHVFPFAKVVSAVSVKGTDGDVAEVRVTIEARLGTAAAASSTDTAPYTIEQV
jgi:hypothetical protein